MINNPKTARIIAVVVIAMLVITLAASLFGCAAAKPSASDSTDPDRPGGPTTGLPALFSPGREVP